MRWSLSFWKSGILEKSCGLMAETHRMGWSAMLVRYSWATSETLPGQKSQF